ncbi:peptidoglycan-binding LysM domain-containing protein [Thalictrum thalictroides]|uniref:Peptidoglycan-binding LysM domain-containing protein n=1 Tax=Thalictrum thalictroides TaxID=46969 RepID=A0A7J6W511_THATH|nr:peptidoglycan-binding LysM domain-containing protein [Thalictrum thalictroides]
MAERVAWRCGLFLAIVLLLSCCDSSETESSVMMNNNNRRPCDEIYVVGEGETLHTISEKCGDPYIVEENPHINDPDDVFPGLVIKITPFIVR